MKKTCIAFQIILLVWFFLDMIGVYFGDKCLVTQSYKEDGVFFQIGKWIVAVWTSIWFVIQFLCHEWYTIFNGGIMGSLEGKIKYFSETVQWIKIEGKYIPDIYHTVLHILILLVIITTFMFIKKTGNKKQ